MSELRADARRPLWRNMAALLGYLLLTIVMTWPLVTRLGIAPAGGGTDVWVHQWTYWWIKQALLSGQNPYYTTLLYYPNGVALTSHNIAWFNIALWLPLQSFLGSVAAYNLVFIIVLALNGFAFYLFAKAETGKAAAAFVGGLIFGFWPYTLSHSDHPNMMVTFWAPLTMLFMLRIFRQGRVRDAVFAGLCLALLGITRWQLLVMSAPILLAYALYLAFREKDYDPRRVAALVLLFVGLGALLMAPLGMPLVLDQMGRSGPEVVAIEEPEYIYTDLIAYVMPPDLYRATHPEAPDPLPWPLWEPYQRIAAGVFYVPFIGLVTLALALTGLWRQWRQTWFWLLVALGIMIMALGPELVINERHFASIPMPYRALSGSLLDALIRRPHRLNNFLGLPMAMMASWGMTHLFARLRARGGANHGTRYAALGALLLGALILWENPVPPIPTTETAVPLWYRNLAGEEESFALLELPFQNRGFDKLYMYYQTFHGKPILVGHVSRLPQEAFDFIDSVPFLEPFKSNIYMWDVAPEYWVNDDVVDVSRQFELLAKENVRYIVLNKPLILEGFIDQWRDWVTFEPVYEDDEVLVYKTAPRAGEDFTIAHPLADGIGLIRVSLAPREANQEGVVKVDARWASSAQPSADYEVCFFLKDMEGAARAAHCAQPVEGWPTSAWGSDSVARGSYVIPITEEIPAGTYTVEMALVEEGDEERGTLGVSLAVGEILVEAFEPQHAVDLCWEPDLCLRGFDLEQNPERLEVTFYWQAAAPLQEPYKRFVHLVDVQSGSVVAQSDAIPRDWTYAPNIWEPGEIVVDRLTLQLPDLPAGVYELRAGWYAVDDEQLLKACPANNCQTQTADYQTLTGIELR